MSLLMGRGQLQPDASIGYMQRRPFRSFPVGTTGKRRWLRRLLGGVLTTFIANRGAMGLALVAALAAAVAFVLFESATIAPPIAMFEGKIEIGASTKQARMSAHLESLDYVRFHGGSLDKAGGGAIPGDFVLLDIVVTAPANSRIAYVVLLTGDARLADVAGVEAYVKGPTNEWPYDEWIRQSPSPSIHSWTDGSRQISSSRGSDSVIYEVAPSQVITGSLPIGPSGVGRIAVGGAFVGSTRVTAGADTSVALPGIYQLGETWDTKGDPLYDFGYAFSPDTRIQLKAASGAPGPWYRPSLSVTTSVGSPDTVLGSVSGDISIRFASPPLLDPALLLWRGSSAVNYAVRDEVERSTLDRMNFEAGILAGLAGACLLEAILRLRRSSALSRGRSGAKVRASGTMRPSRLKVTTSKLPSTRRRGVQRVGRNRPSAGP